MQNYTLQVTKREIFGKKLRKLRREGILPANIYGKQVESLAVQLPHTEFEKVYKEAGETGVVELQFDGQNRPVLIKNVQLGFVTHQPVHVDFYQVNLKEKIRAMVPVVAKGEPNAVAEKLGLLMQTLNEVEVEALPTDLPDKLEVDVTHLAAVGDHVTVADLQKPANVEILTAPEQTIALISELVTKEAEEQAQQEAAASEEAKAESTEEKPTEEQAPQTPEEKEEKTE